MGTAMSDPIINMCTPVNGNRGIELALIEIANSINRLARAVESMAFEPDVPEGACPHQHTRDLSTMGQQPMTHFYCMDCQKEFGE